jgi:hypothetical protein
MRHVHNIAHLFVLPRGNGITRLWGKSSPISLRFALRIHTYITLIAVCFVLFIRIIEPGSVLAGSWSLPSHSHATVIFLNGLVFYVEMFSTLSIATGLFVLFALRGSERSILLYINVGVSLLCLLGQPSFGST